MHNSLDPIGRLNCPSSPTVASGEGHLSCGLRRQRCLGLPLARRIRAASAIKLTADYLHRLPPLPRSGLSFKNDEGFFSSRAAVYGQLGRIRRPVSLAAIH